MNTTFDMVAKTFQGLEEVLAEELRAIGATEVSPGKRMVAFKGDKEIMYRANFCCRTALRILKPFYCFEASDADGLYAGAKQYDWSKIMNVGQTFAIDTVVYSDEFRNSQYVTYRVKDAVVDWFRDHSDNESRPGVRLDGADIMINVHISGRQVTLSLDSSGESLHKRGWRVAQTEAPINEVLAAGIILKTGWKGDRPFVDPMCGSGTFAIEAAMIAAGINPGIYRKHFAFENWADFDADLLESIYNDDSAEREVTVPITACDIDKRALAIALDNAKSAGVERYITFDRRSVAYDSPDGTIAKWQTAGAPSGVLVTNLPYGKRISADDMYALYRSIGSTFKHVFTGWDCWVIGYTDEYFNEIGLAPSEKVQLYNGGLECELREYVIFAGSKRDFRQSGGRIKDERPDRKKEDRPRDDRRRQERPDRRGPREAGERGGRRENGGPRDFRKPRERRDDREPREPRGFKSPRGPKPFDGRRDGGESAEKAAAPKVQGRRPVSIGRQPSIPADKEIVVNRPMWRTRKKQNPETDKND